MATPKTISQAMFDDVVRENMEEFEMDAEAAVQDAIEQFEAQGVNLAIIVKDPGLYSESGASEHPVIAAVKRLRATLDNPDTEACLPELKIIQEQCDLDLSHRCLAATQGAYPAILEVCQKTSREDVRMVALETLCSLCNGQPDVLNEVGMDFFCQLLKQYQDDAALLTVAVRLIRYTCVMHETNRQAYVERSLITYLSTILEDHISSASLVKEACSLLRVLTSDDDVRVPFGKGHEHAKIIVTEGNTLKKIMDICKVYQDNPGVLSELFLTLSRLAVRNEFCQEIMDLGGLIMLLDGLQSNTDNQVITKHVLGLLKTIAGNDDVKVAIAKAGGLELTLAAMAKHARHAGIAEMGCGSLATVCLRQPDHCRRVMEANGAETIVKAMQLHPSEEAVQCAGCLAVRNLIARTREYCPQFLEQGAEAVLRQAQSQHAKCGDTAKAALRDLNCNVELKELWKGEGVTMQR